MSDPILIVGGGPAALAAARGYRDAGGTAPVLLATDDDRPPYDRPPLTKAYLRGEQAAAELPLENDAWYRDHDVELVYAAVTALDPQAHTAALGDRRDVRFTAAVLATGARPVPLPVPGAEDPAVHPVRRVSDADALREATGPGIHVVVVGSGFIGCETAASLARRGAHVTLISDEPAPQAARLGPEVGARIAAWLTDEGVTLELGHPVDHLLRDGDRLHVVAAGRPAVAADVVVFGAGIAPRDELARAAGLGLGPDGRQIRVDARMRTSHPDVFAAGDVALAEHAVAGRALHVEHWGDALAHGEIAGRQLAGDEDARWETVPGFWSTIGDHTLKYAAWGDGHDRVELTDHGAGAFTVRYHDAQGRLVGVLTHERDGDYDAAGEQIAAEAG